MPGEWTEDQLLCFIESYQNNFLEEFSSDLEYLEEKFKLMNDEVQNTNPHSTSISDVYKPYALSPKMDSCEQPLCLGSTLFSEALRKSDKVYQNLMENSVTINHKLDKLIELVQLLSKETNKDDLVEHEYQEVEETIGTSMEVEPLNQTQLEDLGLNTCSHDLSLSFRKVPSVNEQKPQPLPNFPSLDVNLGDKRGTDLPINSYSPDNFKMKVVDPLIIHTTPSPHVAYLHPKSVYYYYHPHLTLSVGKTHLLRDK
ncbi:hypothetical protein Tco_1282569 [Tanacetum coccineum]